MVRTSQTDIIEKIMHTLSPTQFKSVQEIADGAHLPPTTVIRYLKLLQQIQQLPTVELIPTGRGYNIRLKEKKMDPI